MNEICNNEPSSNASTVQNSIRQRKLRKRQFIVLVKLAVGICLFLLVLSRIEVRTVAAMLASVDFRLFGVACLLLLLGVAVNAIRWETVMEVLEKPFPLTNAVIGNVEAMFFNQILPTSVGGDAVRVLRAIDAGISSGFAVMGVLIDRALGLWFVSISILAAMYFVAPELRRSEAMHLVLLIAGIVLAGGVLTTFAGMHLRNGTITKWLIPIVSLILHFSRVVCHRGVAARILLSLVVANALTAASFMICTQSLGLELGAAEAIVVLQGMVLASMVPASLGGWGVREGAAIILLAPMGIGANEATAISIAFGLVLTAVGLFGGVVWLASGYRRFASPGAEPKPGLDRAPVRD